MRDAVAALGNSPEDFAVLIDETRAQHKISVWAMGNILEDLARP
ncbi:MAG: hypothetical protein WD270_07975 [Acetobacterales bacterium]